MLSSAARCGAMARCGASAGVCSSSHQQPAVPASAPLRCSASHRLQATPSLAAANSWRELPHQRHQREDKAKEERTGGDVYFFDPQPLKEGEVKHTISVFVGDESGLINRVAGVFARRGANIESLAVGLTVDKAVFTIAVTGTEATVANLVKQLAKLVKVRYVEDITSAERVERELVLVKLRAPPGPARTELLQMAEVFRARVIDVSERSFTLCVTGDAGKTLSFQKVMSKFGILEVARTGKIALKRGCNLAGQTATEAAALVIGATNGAVSNGAPVPAGTGASNGTAAAAAGGDVVSVSSHDDDGMELAGARSDGDVYYAGGPERGVWEVSNVLDVAYGADAEFEPRTLSIEVQDKPGVLNSVTGVFARRGYNVHSLAVGTCEQAGVSRIVMVVAGTTGGIANLIKQLNKLVYVNRVTDLTDVPFSTRELMLIKVRCNASQRGELRDLATVFRANICDVSPNTCTLEVVGKEDKMRALHNLLEPYGILEAARSGRVAMARSSGIDVRFLDRSHTGQVML